MLHEAFLSQHADHEHSMGCISDMSAKRGSRRTIATWPHHGASWGSHGVHQRPRCMHGPPHLCLPCMLHDTSACLTSASLACCAAISFMVWTRARTMSVLSPSALVMRSMTWWLGYCAGYLQGVRSRKSRLVLRTSSTA